MGPRLAIEGWRYGPGCRNIRGITIHSLLKISTDYMLYSARASVDVMLEIIILLQRILFMSKSTVPGSCGNEDNFKLKFSNPVCAARGVK
jgi:hypothetical protein